MKCGIKCPHWKIRLIGWHRNGVICTKYNLPLLDARDKCTKEGKVFRKKVIRRKIKPILSNPWPGSNRGFGAITMKLDREL